MNKYNGKLLLELHPTKNNGIDINNLYRWTETKVWWKCEKGHEWQICGKSIVSQKTNCPYCSGKLLTKENSLIANNPNIYKKWDYEKNNKKPNEYSRRSAVKVWWKCKEGHSYKRSIAHEFINKKTNCPVCKNSKK